MQTIFYFFTLIIIIIGIVSVLKFFIKILFTPASKSEYIIIPLYNNQENIEFLLRSAVFHNNMICGRGCIKPVIALDCGLEHNSLLFAKKICAGLNNVILLNISELNNIFL